MQTKSFSSILRNIKWCHSKEKKPNLRKLILYFFFARWRLFHLFFKRRSKRKSKRFNIHFLRLFISNSRTFVTFAILSGKRCLDVSDWEIFTKAKSINQTNFFCTAFKNRRFKLKTLSTSWSEKCHKVDQSSCLTPAFEKLSTDPYVPKMI